MRDPGTHRFESPPTLREAIERAGGLEKTSLSEPGFSSPPLETGTLVTIIGEERGKTRIRLGRMEAKKLLVFSIPLDLNQATSDDLCLVPGIGESVANEIVAYRGKRGAFRSVDELKQVSGVGDKKYPALKPFLTVK